VGFQGRTSSFPNIGGEMLGVVAFQVSCGVWRKYQFSDDIGAEFHEVLCFQRNTSKVKLSLYLTN
jgi:hypothetical protein